MIGYKEHKGDIENYYFFKYLKLHFKRIYDTDEKILSFIMF